MPGRSQVKRRTAKPRLRLMLNPPPDQAVSTCVACVTAAPALSAAATIVASTSSASVAPAFRALIFFSFPRFDLLYIYFSLETEFNHPIVSEIELMG